MHPRDQFDRTVCDCPDCQTPCRNMPGMLTSGDLDRIATALGLTVDAAMPLFRASPGAKVGRMNHGTLEAFRIPTIVPAQDNTGACVFLQDGRCTIHAVAPIGCSHFDWHMPRHEGDRRSAACLRAIMADPEYQRDWHTLTARGLTTTAPETKRQKFDTARKPDCEDAAEGGCGWPKLCPTCERAAT